MADTNRHDDQNEWRPNDEEARLLDRLGVSVWMARRLIEVGFEFKELDPDGPSGKRMFVFGHRRIHEWVLGWHEKELSKPVPVDSALVERLVEERLAVALAQRAERPKREAKAPVERATKEAGAPKAKGQTNGERAYDLRLQGKGWGEMGIASALVAAKSYAKSRGLPWPPRAS